MSDLKERGFGTGWTKFKEFFRELNDLLKAEVELKDLKIKADPLEFGVALKQVPGARGKLRKLLEDRLPSIYRLINEVILKEARTWLRDPANGGYEDILIIVDQLDRIPQKVLNPQGLTNHENMFLDNAGTLRALACDVLYTIPIELAYSPCRRRLQDAYGSEILALPLIPVAGRQGQDNSGGLEALCEVVNRRAAKAEVRQDEFFAGPDLLKRLCRLSGGHVRSLFILLRSVIDGCDELPATAETIEETVRRAAADLALPLKAGHWRLLREVHATKNPIENDLWYTLLRDQYIFGYSGNDGIWSDWNPLLSEVKGGP